MKNPYLDFDKCVERLYNDYKKNSRLIVAVDYDSTIAPYHDNEKDIDYSDTINLVLEAQKLNFYICIFTGAPKERWSDIYKYCDAKGILISTINKNPINLPFGNDGKMYYNILLDDRAALAYSMKVLRAVMDRIDKKEFFNKAERV